MWPHPIIQGLELARLVSNLSSELVDSSLSRRGLTSSLDKYHQPCQEVDSTGGVVWV